MRSILRISRNLRVEKIDIALTKDAELLGEDRLCGVYAELMAANKKAGAFTESRALSP